VAALQGLCSVAFGAFAAHGVDGEQAAAWLRTGAHHQAVHALAALACLPLRLAGVRRADLAAWLLLAGAFVFSGALYLLAFTGVRAWGAAAPVGGLLSMAGWAALAWAAFALRLPRV
jgi:uncharacterized membrane protein YgdD (TMEM256/DUF423 family)